jgi:hypothetical protein
MSVVVVRRLHAVADSAHVQFEPGGTLSKKLHGVDDFAVCNDSCTHSDVHTQNAIQVNIISDAQNSSASELEVRVFAHLIQASRCVRTQLGRTQKHAHLYEMRPQLKIRPRYKYKKSPQRNARNQLQVQT